MARRWVSRGHPEATAFPAGLRVVDAAVDPLGEKAHRIGDAQFDDLPANEGMQRIRLVAGSDRHVRSEPEDVLLFDPYEIPVLHDAYPTLSPTPPHHIEFTPQRPTPSPS